MTLPNFFIVGAAKSGTTALYRYLRQHPDVYLPDVKEPRFFSYDPDDRTRYAGPRAQTLIDSIVKDLGAYEELYQGVDGERAIGDASPAYLPSPVAARRIRKAVPDARIVAILRNPVERAYSHFIDNVQSGWEPERDFETVLALRDQRRRENWWRKWDYVGNGFYAEQLARYFDAFDRDRITVYLYEDFKSDPQGMVVDLLTFLTVDPAVQLDLSERHNSSGVPKSERLARLLAAPSPLRAGARMLLPASIRGRLRSEVEARNRAKPEMPAVARAELVEVYSDEVKRLEALIGRDLSAWR